jgi:hypothetical protein
MNGKVHNREEISDKQISGLRIPTENKSNRLVAEGTGVFHMEHPLFLV